MKVLFLSFMLVWTVIAQAQVTGSFSKFVYKPKSFKVSQDYDIFYYIPKSLEVDKKHPVLMFLHGGGQSTLTREGANSAVSLYKADFIKLAEEMKFVLVMPSSSGLNWNTHTRVFLRDLVQDLNLYIPFVDHERVGLAGHSMGGMGITRSAQWLTDVFSYFFPMAAGLDEKQMNEYTLNKVFDVNYYHMQGLGDHFDIFVERCRLQQTKTEELEKIYGVNSKFELEFYQGSHNYEIPLVRRALQKLLPLKRLANQKDLHASFWYDDRGEMIDREFKYSMNSNDSYFWLKVQSFTNTTYERVDLKASIRSEDNSVVINESISKNPIKKLKIFFNNSTLDKTRSIIVKTNTKTFEVNPKMIKLVNKEMEIGIHKNYEYSFELDLI